jgi:hypothetical protein
MSTTRLTRHAGYILTAVAVALGPTAWAPMALADDIVASDDGPLAVAERPTAVAGVPAGIVVSHHDGQPVRVYAKGERTRSAAPAGARPVTFTGLTVGRSYTVTVGGRVIGTATAILRPTAATGLEVRLGPVPGSVALRWQHRSTVRTGGRAISYAITAKAPSTAAITQTVTGHREALLAGLDPSLLYAFTVTPRNSAGAGRPTTAVMRRTLAQAGGLPAVPTSPAPTAPAPAVPVTPAVSVATPAPAPEPEPAPRPTTKTIYACPDGFVPAGDVCTRTIPYTYSTTQETKAYTYHDEWHMTGYSSYPYPCADGDVAYPATQTCGHQTGYYTKTRDAIPQGWLDDGTRWVRDVQVKDPMPSGCTDNGTAWVRTVAKVARTVPA